MIDAFTIGIALIVGAAAGAFSAWLGWNKSGEPFEPRKFVNGVVTGIIGGITLIIANVALLQEAASDTALIIQLITLVLAIVGVDQVRVTVSSAIANRAAKTKAKEEKKEEPAK